VVCEVGKGRLCERSVLSRGGGGEIHKRTRKISPVSERKEAAWKNSGASAKCSAFAATADVTDERGAGGTAAGSDKGLQFNVSHR